MQFVMEGGVGEGPPDVDVSIPSSSFSHDKKSIVIGTYVENWHLARLPLVIDSIKTFP
jgi:hypothetical protein